MNVIGRFYFKLTKNGNLLGEFSNNKFEGVIAECANRKSRFEEKFEGVYLSTWIEDDLAMLYELDIKTKDSLYNLKWTSLNNNSVFYGSGMLVDDILIGDYRDFEI